MFVFRSWYFSVSLILQFGFFVMQYVTGKFAGLVGLNGLEANGYGRGLVRWETNNANMVAK